jgi:hypothetical protein
MSDRTAEVEAALERVIEAARAHLAVVTGRDGAPDDDTVWRAYVTLNNAAYDYDRLLSTLYDEVTPFDVEKIVDESLDGGFVATPTPLAPAQDDPYPRVVSVRQRRDYRVPSVAALLRLAREVRPESVEGEEPIGSVGEAIIELLEAGDGSLCMLDVPELEPLDGVVVVAEVNAALSADGLEEAAADEPFRLAAGESVLARLHEHPPTEEE